MPFVNLNKQIMRLCIIFRIPLYFIYIYSISQELLLYLLQLVQALRYDIEDHTAVSSHDDMPLSGFFTDETFGHPGNQVLLEGIWKNKKKSVT